MKTKNGILLCLTMVMGLHLILINSCSKDDGDNNPSTSITDKDGNIYTSVTIGTQTWMVENLKTQSIMTVLQYLMLQTIRNGVI